MGGVVAAAEKALRMLLVMARLGRELERELGEEGSRGQPGRAGRQLRRLSNQQVYSGLLY